MIQNGAASDQNTAQPLRLLFSLLPRNPAGHFLRPNDHPAIDGENNVRRMLIAANIREKDSHLSP
jgi:hypothetical protein